MFHVTKLDYQTDPDRLKKDFDSLLEDVGFANPNQLTLTSVLGNNQWSESTGKIQHLEYPTNINANTFYQDMKNQDLKIDLPTAGLNTLIQCKKAGLKGLVLKAKQNVLLEKKKCINFVNKNKMFLIAK